MKIYENKKHVVSAEQLGYDCRRYQNKDLHPFCYLTKQGFKDLCYDCTGQIKVVGDVFINQRKYEDIETSPNPEKTESKKERKDIVGVVTIPYSHEYLRNHKDSEGAKKYDLYEHNRFMRRCIGYAQVGDGKYVRLVKLNPLPLLLFVALIVLLAFLLKDGPNFDPITINQGKDIVSSDTTNQSAEPCYYAPFEEVTTLTKDNPCISLTNVATNENEYYISFSIYINGEAMKDENGEIFTTGAIPPNRQVDLNLFNALDKGIYELKAIATDYDFKTMNDLVENEDKYSEREKAELLEKAIMPVRHTLSTTLIIEK